MKQIIILISLFSILFSTSTISLLKENRNILRSSISKSFSLDGDGFDIINEGWRTVQVDYIFNGHYRFFSSYGIDDESKRISFYYYKILNNFFINSGVDIFKYLEDTKFYNQTWIGAGLSRPIIDNIDLSGQFFYGSSIDTENNYTLLQGIVYLDIKPPSLEEVGLQIGLSKDLKNTDSNPGFYFGVGYRYEIN